MPLGERSAKERPVNSMKRKIAIQKRFRWLREERGSALVEFAMTAPLLIFLVFAVLQGMFAMYAYHFTAYAAQQGARFAVVRGATWSENITSYCGTSAPPNFTMVYDCEAQSSDIQNFVKGLGAISPTNLTASTSWPGLTPDGTTTGCTGTSKANSKGCLVKVTVNYTFNFVPFLPFTGLKMSARSEKVILQ